MMKIIRLFLSLLLMANGAAKAESYLTLSPAKCVSLKQGNTCYQEIKISWKSESVGHYCLYQSNAVKPLYCWENVNNGQYVFEFSGVHSVDYLLYKTPFKAPIGKQHFSVKWVYKARPNHRWRLF